LTAPGAVLIVPVAKESGLTVEMPEVTNVRVEIVDGIPVADHIALLREAGWFRDGEDPSAMRRLLDGSFLIAAAIDSQGRTIGMGRMISDGASDGYIQDVVVQASSRGLGLGRRIVSLLAAEGRRRGLGWIGLVAAPGTVPFYRALGFEPMPDHVPMLLKIPDGNPR